MKCPPHHFVVSQDGSACCQKCGAKKQFARSWEELVANKVRLSGTKFQIQPSHVTEEDRVLMEYIHERSPKAKVGLNKRRGE